MKVLISGAGIAGLTLADWLVRFGHEATVVERESDPAKAKGYIIDFWGPGFAVAERMGIVDDLAQRKCEPDQWRTVGPNGKPISQLSVQRFAAALGGRIFSFFRGDLEAVLYDRVRGQVDMRVDNSIEQIEDCGDRIEARLADGSAGAWDVVVGADGVHSQVRRLAFGPEESFSRYLGCDVAAAILPLDPDWKLDNAAYLYNEPAKLVMVFPHASGVAAVYFVHRRPDAQVIAADRRADHLRSVFGGMKWIVPDLLSAITPVTPIFQDPVCQIQMPQWSRGRTVLCGDACQCLTLLAGQGASMAMAGAYALAGELGRANGDCQAAFQRYEGVMRPAIATRQKEARRLSRLFFAPQTRLGIGIRNVLMKLISVPFLFKSVVSPAMAESDFLPRYDERA